MFALTIFLSLKSTIVPLFEKVLSASDAGRIGRLVLPKACAEVYISIGLSSFLAFVYIGYWILDRHV